MNAPQTLFNDDESRWRAVVERNPTADGWFLYSVRTTGVYCRPSCPSRQARRENVCFHASPRHAERAGFRACRRCRPRDQTAAQRHQSAVWSACRQMQRPGATVDLDALAKAVGMSRGHFQRAFKATTAMTPGTYLASCRAGQLREQLAESSTVTEAAYRSGFGSNTRFYTVATQRLGMTPTAFRSGGQGETIRFALGECSLGAVLVATTERGICTIDLGDDPQSLLQAFQVRFAQATLIGGDEGFEQHVAAVVGLVESPGDALDFPLDVRGTLFQHRVWQALGALPSGSTVSYQELARRIGAPSSSRAVAGACAANRLAVAIPCHRVMRLDGSLGGYRWGVERKRQLQQRECQPQISTPPGS